MAKQQLYYAALLILLLPILACNAPFLTPPPTIQPAPTFAPIRVEPLRDGSPTPTKTTAEQSTNNPSATFTPRTTTAITPTAVETTTAPPTETATATIVTEGPLSFTYRVDWRLNPNNGGQAFASVTITAIGGGGNYQYFRDEQPVSGPVFEYLWGSCAGNPGSFRVTSADGQTVKSDYFEHPPCP